MKKQSKPLTRDQRLIRQLTRELNSSLQLLEHQHKHLVFLETLLGKSVAQVKQEAEATIVLN